MLKRLSGIMLIVVMILPFSATYLFLQHQKQTLKKSVKRSLMEKTDRSELVKLVFSVDEIHTKLKWEHDKEFEFNGKMYDIVESVKKNDTIIYYCWLDKEETKLNIKLKKLVSYALGNTQKDNNAVKHLKKFAQSIFSPESLVKQNIQINKESIKYIFKNEKIIKLYLNIGTPPPQSIS